MNVVTLVLLLMPFCIYKLARDNAPKVVVKYVPNGVFVKFIFQHSDDL